ncbi:MAG: lamin tail domain-containing protein [Paludibacteraceae bacterium]|nr:lamin tail domain-containing protein [Paludibacteraceae bacterium]
MKDLKGWLLPAMVVCFAPSEAAVYVTEIAPKSVFAEGAELPSFVELYNSADTIVVLSGWRLATGRLEYVFNEQQEMAPNSTLCVLRSSGQRGSSDFGGVVLYTNQIDLLGNQLKLMNSEGRTLDSLSYREMNFPVNMTLHRDSVELTHDGCVLLGDSRLVEGIATPGWVPGMTERRKSLIHFHSDMEDDTYTLTMTYDVRNIETNEENETKVENEEEPLASYYFPDYVLTRPNPVKTTLYVRIADPSLEFCRYTLQNAMGIVVAQGDLVGGVESQIEMAGMLSGSYILYIEKDGESYPFKIQKK